MADDPGFRIVALKLAQQVEQGTTLGVGAGIGRLIILVQPALITDTYALIVLCHDIIWVFCYFFCHSEKKKRGILFLSVQGKCKEAYSYHDMQRHREYINYRRDRPHHHHIDLSIDPDELLYESRPYSYKHLRRLMTELRFR